MLKMEYTKETLYISLKGSFNKNKILDLKRKLYHVVSDYDITDILLDIRETSFLDKECFYAFLDDYDQKYGGHLDVLG